MFLRGALVSRFGHIGQFWGLYIFGKLRSCTFRYFSFFKALIDNLNFSTSWYLIMNILNILDYKILSSILSQFKKNWYLYFQRSKQTQKKIFKRNNKVFWPFFGSISVSKITKNHLILTFLGKQSILVPKILKYILELDLTPPRY